jgi:hypothetical protein
VTDRRSLRSLRVAATRVDAASTAARRRSRRRRPPTVGLLDPTRRTTERDSKTFDPNAPALAGPASPLDPDPGSLDPPTRYLVRLDRPATDRLVCQTLDRPIGSPGRSARRSTRNARRSNSSNARPLSVTPLDQVQSEPGAPWNARPFVHGNPIARNSDHPLRILGQHATKLDCSTRF